MHVAAVTSGNGTGKKGQRRCQHPDCGLRFAARPRQQVNLCPFHHRLYLARLERERKARWRARVRLLAALYNAGTGRPPSD